MDEIYHQYTREVLEKYILYQNIAEGQKRRYIIKVLEDWKGGIFLVYWRKTRQEI